MINLLPPKEKKELMLERNKKLTIVLGFIALISLIYLLLILVSLKFYILKKAEFKKSILENTQQEYQQTDLVLLKEDINKYNKLLIKVDDFYKNKTYFSNAVKNILLINRPEGVYFTNIGLVEDIKNAKIKASISGVSSTRENLIAFKENIEQSSVFEDGDRIENLYFPPESWVKPNNINFYLTFNIAKSK